MGPAHGAVVSSPTKPGRALVPVSPELRTEVEDFVYREADMLDRRAFDEWLALFSDDALYWVPNHAEEGSLDEDGIIFYDDLHALRARVAKLCHPLNPTQIPLPRTQHMLGNLLVEETPDGVVTVNTALVIYVVQGDEQRQFPGRCRYSLCRTADGRWQIREKRVYLIGNDQPLSLLPLL
jgi:3-phenylpropionate/cinnamic acid dioxygenase small subunit